MKITKTEKDWEQKEKKKKNLLAHVDTPAGNEVVSLSLPHCLYELRSQGCGV